MCRNDRKFVNFNWMGINYNYRDKQSRVSVFFFHSKIIRIETNNKYILNMLLILNYLLTKKLGINWDST